MKSFSIYPSRRYLEFNVLKWILIFINDLRRNIKKTKQKKTISFKHIPGKFRIARIYVFLDSILETAKCFHFTNLIW